MRIGNIDFNLGAEQHLLSQKKNCLEQHEKLFEQLKKGKLEKIESKIIDLIGKFSLYFKFKNNLKIDIKEEAIITHSFFDEILDQYDDYLNDDFKVEALFSISDPICFRNYALKHYNLFQKKLKKIVFFNIKCGRDNDLNDIQELQSPLDWYFKEKEYKAFIVSDTFFSFAIEFYHLFHHVTNFSCDGKIEKWDYYLFKKVPFHQLMNLLSKEINENSPFINSFWYFILNTHLYELYQDNFLFQDQKHITSFLLFLSTMNSTQLNKITHKELGYDETLGLILEKIRAYLQENKIKEELNLEESLHDFFSISYLNALNSLKEIKSKERKKQYLYLKCFQIFLKEFQKKFNEDIDKSDLIIIESLFQRMIQGKNMIKPFSITNKKTLYHYYKTNELILNIDLSLTQIKQYNAKQYLALEKEYAPKMQYLDELRTPEIYKNITDFDGIQKMLHLKLLVYLGFDFLTKSRVLEHQHLFDYLVKIIREKDQEYIEKLKKVLSEDFTILVNEHYPFDLVLSVFDYLYSHQSLKITLQKIKKTIDSCNYILFPNNRHIGKNLEKLNFVHKGDPLYEKIEGIKLYDSYRFRIASSIPDIIGRVDEYSYQMVDMHDSNIISNGIGEYCFPNHVYTSSCLTPNGKASSCLFHGATSPHGRFFKVTFHGKIVAYSWVWRSGDILCFDNIELTKTVFENKEYDKIISKIYLEATDQIMKITKQQEKRGIQLVILGKNPIDIPIPEFDQLPKVNQYTSHLYKPNSDEALYLKDSANIQIILGGEYSHSLRTEDIEPKYLYSRNNPKKFHDIPKNILIQKLNAIYFDYCTESNITYHPLRDKYIDGVLNEDWFVGIKPDQEKDFFYCGKDERLFEEAKKYISVKPIISNSVTITKSKEERLNYLLDLKNYVLEKEKLQEYLKKYSSEKFILSSQDYLHGTGNLSNFGKILLENQITAAHYGNHSGRGGSNGNYYICVAKIENSARSSYYVLPSFVLDKDICVFSNSDNELATRNIRQSFRNTSYPLRDVNYANEYQVLNSISLSKAKAILVTVDDVIKIGQIVYLQQLSENNLPLVLIENQQILDKEIIKKYVKIK